MAQRLQHNHKQQQEKVKALQEELQTREKEKDEWGRHAQEAQVLLTQKAARAEESARQFSLKLQEKVRMPRSCGAMMDLEIIQPQVENKEHVAVRFG